MKRSTKAVILAAALTVTSLGSAPSALAHVTVKPAEVKSGAYQTFTVSVPVEKDSATIGVKLDIPEGVESVTPTVKPGWTIAVEKTGEGEDATTKSIIWTGGSIAHGQRDDFTFSAKTPPNPTELQWKAHQTYASGVVVHWDLAADKQPKKADGSPDFSTSGPFSITKIVDQTADQAALRHNEEDAHAAQAAADRAFYVALGALAVAVVALVVASRKPSRP